MTPVDHMFTSDGDSVPALECSDGSVSSGVESQEDDGDKSKSIAKGGVTTPFPWKLHDMLDDMDEKGMHSVVRWLPHGRAFMVHKPKEFVEDIMHHYFNQTKYASFQRQLNLYGFSRLCHGRDKGAYYHECFVRGERELCRGMVRQKIKGTKVRRSLSPEEEPNFYSALYNRTKKQPLQVISKVVQKPNPPPVAPPAVSLGPKPVLLKPKPDARSPVLQKPQLPNQPPSKPQGGSNAGTAPCAPPPTSLVSLMTEASKTTKASASEVRPPTSLVSLMTGTIRTPNPIVLPAFPLIKPLPPPARAMSHGSVINQPPSVKAGDLLFFEGQPFRYLEHIEELLL
jgi:hypothetical protein